MTNDTRPTPETDAMTSSNGSFPSINRRLTDLARSLERRLAEAEDALDSSRGMLKASGREIDALREKLSDTGERITALRSAHDKALARVRELETVIYMDKSALPGAFDDLHARAMELEGALKFYADGEHFVRNESLAWDTVSDEPANFWCDEAETATVEDGWVARAALQAGEKP